MQSGQSGQFGKDGFSLGRVLRGRRLGYAIVPGKMFQMRLTNVGYGIWRVDLCPAHILPPDSRGSKKHRELHVVWWPADLSPESLEQTMDLIKAIPWVSNINHLKRHVSFTVNENGEIVG